MSEKCQTISKKCQKRFCRKVNNIRKVSASLIANELDELNIVIRRMAAIFENGCNFETISARCMPLVLIESFDVFE